MDGYSITAAARELFAARQFPGCVAVCAEAIATLAPTDRNVLVLRLLTARSLMALRRDADAQHEIRACLQAEPQCGPAYRLLGELALRADELTSAKIFLREALRLGPDDDEAREWLAIVESMAAVPGRPSTRPPASAPAPAPVRPRLRVGRLPVPTPATAAGTPAPVAPRGRASSPALPLAAGFGQHLVEAGLLTPVQLKAALVYTRSTGVRLGAAAVALGFVSAPKIEWASLAYHGRHRQGAIAR
ncbi:MAG: hypothetical protein R3B06_13115 [Kofleriaceae bacterium]